MQIDLNEIHPKKGAHGTCTQGVCAMEMVAYMAGEPHSDHPTCACPVIAAFAFGWSAQLDAADRDRILKPLLQTLIGTAHGPATEERRVWLIIDWLVREWTPAWLELSTGLTEHGATLRALPVITDLTAFKAAILPLNAASEAAYAARDAARDAAWATAEWDAAWAAAGDAAKWAAAGDAAKKFLRPTVERLQASAVSLIERMIEVR